MAYLFAILFLISGILLIIGLIKPGLVLRWGSVKKRKKVFYIFAPLMLLFLILVGIFAPKDKDTGRMEQKNPNLFSPKSILAIVEKDPDYQDWLEIEKKTTPFREDEEWIANVFEFLLEKNKKWKAKDDQSLLHDKALLIKKKKAEYLDDIRKDFKRRIFTSIYVKKASALPVSFEVFQNFVRSYRFDFYFKTDDIVSSYWSSNKFCNSSKIEYGKTKGDGECFISIVDQNGNMMDISIPLKKVKIDFIYYSVNDPQKRLQIQKEAINKIFSNPPPWLSESLKLFLGEDARIVESKILEIGKADNNRLKEIFPNTDLGSVAPTCDAALVIGDRDISIFYANGTGYVGIQKSDTRKTVREVFLQEL